MTMVVVFVTTFAEFANYADIITYLSKEILKCTEPHPQSNL